MEERAVIDLLSPLIDKAKSYQSELSGEREKFYKWYRSEPYGNERQGWAQTVHPTIFSAVEWIKPGLFEIFTGDFFDLKPRVMPGQDPAQAQEAADRLKAYVRFKLFEELSGEQIIEDFIHDTLTSHYGVFKVCHRDEWELKTEQAPEIPHAILPQIEADPAFVALHGGEDVSTVDPLTGQPVSYVSGATLVRKERKYYGPSLEVIPARELYMLPGYVDLDKNPFVAHVVKRDLDYIKRKEMDGTYRKGAYAALLAKAEKGGLEVPETSGEEGTEYDVDGLTKPTGGVFGHSHQERPTEDNATVLVWECYTRMKLDGTGLLKPVIVTVCEDVMLRGPVENPYGSPPFELGYVYKEPHKTVGRPLAQILDHRQRVLSNLLRCVQDAAAMSTYRGFMTDDPRTKKALAAHGPGDVSFVPALNHVQPLEPGAPSAFIMNAFELTLQEVSKETGVNENMQGLDNNSLNKTAAGMEMRLTAGMQRQRLYARRMARTFKRVLQRVLDIIRLYPPEDDVQAVGADVLLAPDDLNAKFSVEINVGVGPQDRMHNAQMMDQLIGVQLQAGLHLGLCEPKHIVKAIKAKYDYLDINVSQFVFDDSQMDIVAQLQQQNQQLQQQVVGMNQAIEEHQQEMAGQQDSAGGEMQALQVQIEQMRRQLADKERDYALKEREMQANFALKGQELELKKAEIAASLQLKALSGAHGGGEDGEGGEDVGHEEREKTGAAQAPQIIVVPTASGGQRRIILERQNGQIVGAVVNEGDTSQ